MLEPIFKAIDEKVKSEIAQIQEEKDKAILALNKDSDKEREQKCQKEKDVLLEKNKREIMEAQKRLELQNKFVIEQAKRQILEEVYQAALLKITKLNNNDWQRIIERLVKLLPSELTGRVMAGKRTAPILHLILPGRQFKVNDDLIEEGFLVISPHLEIDLRFSQILEQNREKTDPEILKILFS